MKSILTSVTKHILNAAKSPEEAVKYFFKNVIQSAKLISLNLPRHAKVIPIFQERAIDNRLSESNKLVEDFEDFLNDLILDWVALAKKWKDGNTKDRVLINESLKYKEKVIQAFLPIKEASKQQYDNLTFVLENYDISEDNLVNIKEVQKKLLSISDITYEFFIKKLKEG